VEHFRIDEEYSNAFEVWKKMGSPQSPSPEQYASLEKAGRLASLPPASLKAENGAAQYRFTLPRKGVSLIQISK
jgi:xylan 1,4-beta-xylosidase